MLDAQHQAFTFLAESKDLKNIDINFVNTTTQLKGGSTLPTWAINQSGVCLVELSAALLTVLIPDEFGKYFSESTAAPEEILGRSRWIDFQNFQMVKILSFVISSMKKKNPSYS